MSEEKVKINLSDIPEYDLKRFLRATYEACERFYSDPKNVERFEKWKAEKDKSNNN